MLVRHLLAFPLLVVLGCAAPAVSAPPAHTAPPQTAPEVKRAAVKAPGEATIGDRTTCPTSGEEFTVTAKSPKLEYRGRTYYFCCSGCDAEFAQDPEKYLKNGPDA